MITNRCCVVVFLVLACACGLRLDAQVFDGLALANPLYNRTVRLIDTAGRTVNSWTCTGNIAYTPYLMPDSSIWRPQEYSGARMRGGAYGGLIERINWDGTVRQSFIWSDADHQQHHDICPMPNGHILVVAWARKTQAEAQAMGRVNINGEMWPDEIIEYDPDADSAVWEWRAWDHLIQNVDSLKPNYGVIAEHPELIDINLGTIFMGGDWLHVNCADYNEQRDEIAFSSHFTSELYVIDHSTTTEEAAGHTGGRHGKGGDILYRWGNPMCYGRGDSLDEYFFVVHGTNWIRPGLRGAGNIMAFNNGDRPGSANDYSTVVELTPPLDSLDNYHIAPDSAFGPTEPSWLYQNPGSFYSAHTSGAYRMPNDNTFICEGWSGRLLEVTYDGQVVWQYNLGSWTGRVLKYPRDTVETGLKAEPSSGNRVVATLAGSPNPFRQAVQIRYGVPVAGRVKITVHDVTGRIADVVEEGVHDAGMRSVRYAPGARLPAGVYFARLETAAGTGEGLRHQSSVCRLVKE